MKQVLRNSKGLLAVEEVPAPILASGRLLVKTAYSLISVGTEGAILKEARTGLLTKAKSQPEQVRTVLNKLKNQGLTSTVRQVREKLDEWKPIGYSTSGVVIGKAQDIAEFEIGDRVACAGHGLASHSEIVSVPKHLTARVPTDVSLKDAAFTTVGAIAMQGVRRASPTFGETVVVIGLGLIGQLTAQILCAAGCRVIGTDLDPKRVERARKHGLHWGIVAGEDDPVNRVLEYTDGIGADAVIVCASTPSSEPAIQAMKMARRKGRVVVVGAVGMDLPRVPFYEKELDFLISTSYGPGRYDKSYEEKGIDYPLPYVRWTENRNMAEFLRLISEGKIVLPIDAEYPIERAVEAYERIMEGEDKPIGVLLKYGDGVPSLDFHPRGGEGEREGERDLVLSRSKRKAGGNIRVAVIGAGGMAKAFHLPNLAKIEDFEIYAIVDLVGSNAKQVAQKVGAKVATTAYREVLEDENVDLVLIATHHNLHVPIAVEAAKAGKHIFVEKPMAMTYEEIDLLREALQASNVHFTVGFNRRFSPVSIAAKRVFEGRKSPLMIHCRVNAGFLPPDHWTNDREEGGGRIIGEACHFFDLCYFFTDAQPKEISAHRIVSSDARIVDSDNVSVSLRYEDGSIAHVFYTTIGPKALPKERVEIYGGGRAAVIDDFRTLTTGIGDKLREKKWRLQNKGQCEEWVEFAQVIKGEKTNTLGFEEALVATRCALEVRSTLHFCPEI